MIDVRLFLAKLHDGLTMCVMSIVFIQLAKIRLSGNLNTGADCRGCK